MGGFELQISILLFFALSGYLLSSKLDQSAVVVIIIIGIVIGPSVLGLVRYTDAVKMIAHLGAILLLFSVGLEFRIREVFKMEFLFIAVSGLVLPWIGGYLTGVLFGFGFRESMFVGVSLTATSIAISAKVLAEMKKLHTRAARAIIGAAVIDDVLGLFALSVAVQMSGSGISPVSLMKAALQAGLFMSAGILLSPHIKKMLTKLDEKRVAERFPDFMFILAVMLCFLFAALAEIVGLSAIVGAFLAGAVLEGIKFKNSKDLKEGAEYLHVIFGAIFFISLGILADMRQLPLRTLSFGAMLAVVAVLTKVAGCGLSSRACGYGSGESLIIGFGMSPRGEVAMIVALIGLTSGFINQDIYVSVVLMSILTTVVTPVIIKKLKWTV